MMCVLPIVVLVGFDIASYLWGARVTPVYGDGIVNAIPIHCDGIQHFGHFFIRPKRFFGSKSISEAFALRAYLLICAEDFLTKTCVRGWNCHVHRAALSKLCL